MVLYAIEKDATGDYLVAAEDMPAGTLVLTEGGDIYETPTMHTVQVDETNHLDCKGPIRLTNHSCDPSCRMALAVTPPSTAAADAATTATCSLVTRRAVARGERLTFDYALTEWDMAAPFDCVCGEAACRGSVRGFRHLSADTQRRLAGAGTEGGLAPHVERCWRAETGGAAAGTGTEAASNGGAAAGTGTEAATFCGHSRFSDPGDINVSARNIGCWRRENGGAAGGGGGEGRRRRCRSAGTGTEAAARCWRAGKGGAAAGTGTGTGTEAAVNSGGGAAAAGTEAATV
ncbi:hypothetical protein JKP88DRAFT_286761 [Tribonema minus]|uniref:Post-SET domain-containing protein n=1 Tax=Tribonema minus TaxID=303371 RepID=A0A836CN25_9STRA|nr:hypothetical protein JKP88DRAFT_286761 [Tribonema minus]